jgi:anti-anti-sigma factor
MRIAYLCPTGSLDVERGRSLLAQIESKLSENAIKFYLDFAEVSSIDESGLDYLLQGVKRITKTQRRLLLFTLNASVRSIFETKGLDLIFEIYP